MKLHRKIFMGVMSILLLITTFTASTYAWFKINSSANIEGFDFQVHSGQGFQVSIDGIHYYQDLDLELLKKAFIIGYDSERYGFDDQENIIYKSTQTIVANSELDRILHSIQLLPRTSEDGIVLKDLYNANSTASEGSYLEFGVYFKTVSNASEDNQTYEVYLSSEETVSDDGAVIAPTSITSAASNVLLKANMNSILGEHVAGDTIEVYSANALRMSIQDTSIATPDATIYEISNEKDLGSYATDYNGEDEVLDRLYNADHNAMFTYYNTLRPSHPISKMEFDRMPQTIRTLSTVDNKITTISSGGGANLVTFRFWLEGWDADCFDGLDKSINVKLSFTSNRI